MSYQKKDGGGHTDSGHWNTFRDFSYSIKIFFSNNICSKKIPSLQWYASKVTMEASHLSLLNFHQKSCKNTFISLFNFCVPWWRQPCLYLHSLRRFLNLWISVWRVIQDTEPCSECAAENLMGISRAAASKIITCIYLVNILFIFTDKDELEQDLWIN